MSRPLGLSRPAAKRTTAVSVIMALLVSMLVMIGGGKAHASITNTRADAAGTLELAGSSWLSGKGVDVYSNGANELTTWGDNYVTPPSGGTPIYSGYKWQCVELINRLYISQGWISARWTGNGGDMYGTAPAGMTKQPQGSITSIVPGDVIVLTDSSVGHVAIVDSVGAPDSSGNQAVSTVSQNTTAVYYTATLHAGSLTWSGKTAVGVVHSPSNTFTSGSDLLAIRTGGNIYGKTKLDGSWSPALNPSTVADMRVSGMRITWTGTDGNLYAKDVDIAHGFGNAWAQEYGALDQYAASSSVLAIRIGGNIYAKAGLSDAWSSALNPGSVSDVRVSGNRITWTGTNGHVYAKDWDAVHGFGNAWIDECGAVDQYAASDQLFVVRSGIGISGKSALAGAWTYNFNASSVADVRVSGNTITYTDTSGNVWAKQGLTGAWIQESSTVDQYAASDQLFVVRSGANISGKLGITGSWVYNFNGSPVADIRVSGNRITYTDTSGNVWAKDGLGGTWYEEYGAVDQYAAS